MFSSKHLNTLHYNLHTSVVRKRERSEERRTKKLTRFYPSIPVQMYLFLHSFLQIQNRVIWKISRIFEHPHLSDNRMHDSSSEWSYKTTTEKQLIIYPSLSIAVSLKDCVSHAHRHTPKRKKIWVMIQDYDPKSLGRCQGLRS